MISQTPPAFWDQIQMFLFVHRYEGSHVRIPQTNWSYIGSFIYWTQVQQDERAERPRISSVQHVYHESCRLYSGVYSSNSSLLFICLTDVNVINALVSIKAIVSWLCLGVQLHHTCVTATCCALERASSYTPPVWVYLSPFFFYSWFRQVAVLK